MRNAWINAGLAAASLALGAALLEVGTRLYERQAKAQEITAETFRGRTTVNLGALNYNDGTLPTKRPDGQFRVLSLGDSFAYTITRHPYSYHGIAAGRLSRDREVRIVNLGEPAISYPQYIKGYDTWGEVFEHDGVVFNTFIGNDLLDVIRFGIARDLRLNRIFGGAEIDIETGRPRRIRPPHKFALRFLDYAYMYVLSASNGDGPPVSRHGAHYNFAVSPLGRTEWIATLRAQLDNFDPDKVGELAEGYRAFTQLIQRAQAARAAGKKVMVLLSPNQTQVEDDLYLEVVRSTGRPPDDYDRDLPAFLMASLAREIDAEIPLIDLRPALRCAVRHNVSAYYQTDTHWSEDGNRIVGEVLAAVMAKRWFAAEPAPAAEESHCVTSAAAEQPQPPAPSPARLAALAALKSALAATPRTAAASPPPAATTPGVTIAGRRFGLGADIAGWVEFATENDTEYRIIGWAYDRADPSTPVGIAAVSRGKPVMTHQTDIHRPDVSKDAKTNVAAPGFEFTVDKAALAGPVRFFAYVPGRNMAAELPCNPEKCEVPRPR